MLPRSRSERASSKRRVESSNLSGAAILGCSSIGRAPVSDTGGSRFEAERPSQVRQPEAQQDARGVPNSEVVGSSPTGLTR